MPSMPWPPSSPPPSSPPCPPLDTYGSVMTHEAAFLGGLMHLLACPSRSSAPSRQRRTSRRGQVPGPLLRTLGCRACATPYGPLSLSSPPGHVGLQAGRLLLPSLSKPRDYLVMLPLLLRLPAPSSCFTIAWWWAATPPSYPLCTKPKHASSLPRASPLLASSTYQDPPRPVSSPSSPSSVRDQTDAERLPHQPRSSLRPPSKGSRRLSWGGKAPPASDEQW
jgi:hypothetical protein